MLLKSSGLRVKHLQIIMLSPPNLTVSVNCSCPIQLFSSELKPFFKYSAADVDLENSIQPRGIELSVN